MKRLFLVVLLLALAGTTQAIDIKGKWGLGVGAGGLIGSYSEASLIRGKTGRTAWILDLQFRQKYFEQISDTSRSPGWLVRTMNLDAGPRFRRFTRPQAKLSPYWDAYAHVVSYISSTNPEDYHRDAGAAFGFAGGVEYFTPWHFSLAAHTDVFSMEVRRGWVKNYGTKYRNFTEEVGFSFKPQLQLRVYF